MLLEVLKSNAGESDEQQSENVTEHTLSVTFLLIPLELSH